MTRTWAVAFFTLAACARLDDEIEDTRCGDLLEGSNVDLVASETPVLSMTGTTVKIRGTARHVLGLAIRRITVAGLDATSDSFNFAAWSIDLPADVVTRRLPADAVLPLSVMLPLTANDTCSGESVAVEAEATVTVTD